MSEISDVLLKISMRKREEVAERKKILPLALLEDRISKDSTVRGFSSALQVNIDQGKPAVIAEIKRASPSKGLLRADFKPDQIAKSYEHNGAACLSVLTDRDFFQGSDDHLRSARKACSLPVLRKDFVVDPYQIYEARFLGADAILLIAAVLGDHELREYSGIARHLGMDVLLEIHTVRELDRVLNLDPPEFLLGINNRDLRTFQVDLQTTLDLLPRIPPNILIVTESGLMTRADIARMRARGVHVFLVGEAFMRAPDPGVALAELFANA
ncbi:Indole-3-glycerol phosphate synthase [Gammaproteobacteria bacterium]